MSQARKLRRKVKMNMANLMSNEKADQIIEEYFDRDKLRKEIYEEAVGEMMLLFAGYQRLYEKRGKKKIAEAVENFVSFCSDMIDNKTKFREIMDVLRDETGYDYNEHAKQLHLQNHNLSQDK